MPYGKHAITSTFWYSSQCIVEILCVNAYNIRSIVCVLWRQILKEQNIRLLKNIQTITQYRVCLKMLGHIIECNLGYIIKLLGLIDHVFSIFWVILEDTLICVWEIVW